MRRPGADGDRRQHRPRRGEQRRTPHLALIPAVQQRPSPEMGRSGQSEGEQPERSPGGTPHPAAPSAWKSKDGGAPWGTVDWAFLPVGAAGPGGGCSWHGFAAAKWRVAVGDGLVWSRRSVGRAAPAEPDKGSYLRSPGDARDPFASPGRGSRLFIRGLFPLHPTVRALGTPTSDRQQEGRE